MVFRGNFPGSILESPRRVRVDCCELSALDKIEKVIIRHGESRFLVHSSLIHRLTEFYYSIAGIFSLKKTQQELQSPDKKDRQLAGVPDSIQSVMVKKMIEYKLICAQHL